VGASSVSGVSREEEGARPVSREEEGAHRGLAERGASLTAAHFTDHKRLPAGRDGSRAKRGPPKRGRTSRPRRISASRRSAWATRSHAGKGDAPRSRPGRRCTSKLRCTASDSFVSGEAMTVYCDEFCADVKHLHCCARDQHTELEVGRPGGGGGFRRAWRSGVVPSVGPSSADGTPASAFGQVRIIMYFKGRRVKDL